MGAFDQNIHFSTLRKSERPVEELEDELFSYSDNTGVALGLPAHVNEFKNEYKELDKKRKQAVYGIIDSLKPVRYIKEIVMPLGPYGEVSQEDFRYVRDERSIRIVVTHCQSERIHPRCYKVPVTAFNLTFAAKFSTNLIWTHRAHKEFLIQRIHYLRAIAGEHGFYVKRQGSRLPRPARQQE